MAYPCAPHRACDTGGNRAWMISSSARLNIYIRASEGGNGPRNRALARQSDPSRTRQASSLHPLESCIDAFRNRNKLEERTSVGNGETTEKASIVRRGNTSQVSLLPGGKEGRNLAGGDQRIGASAEAGAES